MAELSARAKLSPWPSLVLGLIAFGIDRLHKGFQVDMMGWRGGEIVPVTSFFDYVLVWNTGISYGLLSALPVWGLLAIAVVATGLLAVWWFKADAPLTRYGLALCIGGAVSNGIDRWIYGAVADFFHFHWGTWSFYIFNIADMAITLGVLILIVDVFMPRRDIVATGTSDK